MPFHGGDVLIGALKALGAKRIFAVPGESYLAVLDALYAHKTIQLITCRQEGGAAMMAEAHGKLSNTPGICFVTRGPGATNASAGLHIAAQDSTPMILFIGQVGRNMLEREAFQEIDYRRTFSPIVKWVGQVEQASRLTEYVNRAWHTAVSGRPGPVVLALPEDILSGGTLAQPLPSFQATQTGVTATSLEQIKRLLETSKSPLILTGRAGWTQAASQSLKHFAQANNIPVAATFRAQDTFDNNHPNYIGDVGIGINPKLTDRIKNTDTLLVIGARLGEMTSSSYSLFDIPQPRQSLIHVYPGAEELNSTYAAKIAINCDVTTFCQAIETLELVPAANQKRLALDRANYENWNQPVTADADVQLSHIIHNLSQSLPKDALLTNGAGNYSAWLHRFFRYKQYHTQLAPTCGSMGYGLPAALAAKSEHPDRCVICFAGDGCLQMTIAELATATQFKLNIIVILINNNSWGTIRMHQEKHYPKRIKGTELVNPDFPKLAQAYGFHTELVNRTDEFMPAFQRAQTSNKPALIEISHPLDVITPTLRLDQLNNP